MWLTVSILESTALLFGLAAFMLVLARIAYGGQAA